MTRRNYYMLSLWLPALWPVVIMFGEMFLHSYTWHQMSKLSGLILISGMFGGIQYLIFAVLVSVRFARQDASDIQRGVWFLPTVFAPICSFGCWVLFKLITIQANQIHPSDNPPVDLIAISCDIAIFTLVLGYGYIVLLQIVLYGLDRFGYIED